MSYSVRKRKTLKGGLLMLLVTMLIVYASRQTTVTLIYVCWKLNMITMGVGVQ